MSTWIKKAEVDFLQKFMRDRERLYKTYRHRDPITGRYTKGRTTIVINKA